MMLCEYECYQIGGPWIAENPRCPVHGVEAQRHSDDLDRLSLRVDQAETLADLREILHEIIEIMHRR
jgi:hypothetical protein